jgi:hypothetical protein
MADPRETATPRRLRCPKARPGELRAAWGRIERGERACVVYVAGGGGAWKGDSVPVMEAFEVVLILGGPSMLRTLEERGYDLTTLRFSIQKKVACNG